MNTYRKNLKLIFGLIIVALLVTLASHKHGDILAQNPQPSANDPDLPLVEYPNANNPSTAQKARKRRHSLRQDKSIAELPTGVEPLPLNAHLWDRLPALPIDQSNAVVLGNVTGRRAILTDDQQGIYSEFSIHVTRVFKDDQGLLSVGRVLEATRLGGAVRFPSGRVQRYAVFKQGYPQQGKLYLLFLKRDEEGDFSILTGYELSGGAVNPLDGDSESPENDLQFRIYRGASKESFLNDLQTAIAASGRGAN